MPACRGSHLYLSGIESRLPGIRSWPAGDGSPLVWRRFSCAARPLGECGGCHCARRAFARGMRRDGSHLPRVTLERAADGTDVVVRPMGRDGSGVAR